MGLVEFLGLLVVVEVIVMKLMVVVCVLCMLCVLGNAHGGWFVRGRCWRRGQGLDRERVGWWSSNYGNWVVVNVV